MQEPNVLYQETVVKENEGKFAASLCHRIRSAMAQVERPPLGGKVEMDETFVGGKNRYKGREHRWDNKEVVIGIRERGGELRFFHAEDVKTGTLAKYIQENISDDVEVLYTDDSKPYQKASGDIRKTGRHKVIRHSSHTNTIESAFSLLKRGVMGTWHRISAKHLQSYCNEMCFRFNNRNNPYLFRDTILKPISSQNIEYKELTAPAA